MDPDLAALLEHVSIVAGLTFAYSLETVRMPARTLAASASARSC